MTKNQENLYKKGSVWRKWDLHIHCPSKYTCAKNDQYTGSSLEDKQSYFIKELEKLQDVSVVGITDYFSLEGYKKVINSEIDLKNIDLILPNIELRLSPETNDGKKINIHIIPNTAVLTVDEIEEFLYKFEIKQQGATHTCKEELLISLGKKIDDTTSNEEAFVCGLNQFSITYQKFFERFNEQDENFKNNVLIGVSNNSTDGASGIKDLGSIRNIIYEGVDFIFSAQGSDREYFLGKTADDVEKIITKYNALKPCIHGSDYHGNKAGKKICIPYLDRFCWIKADPTFEGLKQIIYEPEDRVKIQKENPSETKKHWKLDKLIITNSEIDIFPDQEIVFNPYLTSIIGGRATGKSALVKIISFVNGDNDSFIKSIKEKEIKITLKFIDGDGNEKVSVIDRFEYINEAFPIYYLSQEDIEKFSDETRKEEHRKIFLETIGIDNTSYYYNSEKQKMESFINKLKAIDSDEDDFIKYINKLATERKINFSVDTLLTKKAEGIIDNLKKEKDKYSTESTKNAIDEISKRSTIASKIKAIQESGKTQEIQTKAKELNDSVEEYNNQINNNDFVNDEYVEARKDLNIYNIVDLDINIESNATALSDYLENLREECKPYIQSLKDAKIDYKTIQQSLEGIDRTILSLETKKQEFDTNQVSKESIFKKIVEIFNSYELSIKTSENDIQTKFEEFVGSRGELFESIFKGITVTPQRYLAKKKLKYKFKSYFYSGKDEQFSDYFNDLKSDNYFKKFDISFLDKVIARKGDFKKDAGGYYSVINLIYSDFIDNYLQIHPRIIFEGRELGSMSGGQQATLMLKLKLASEGIKKDIIILDQPENHLDNKFINEHLVDLIKLLKNYKQLIVVSHNANVVVISDSEEIIIAGMDKERDKSYMSGSMENNLINKSLVRVLEGGKIAFEQRKKKYNFK